MLPYLGDDKLKKSIVINRLKKELVAGCQFLFSPLSNAISDLDKEVMAVVKSGLLKSGPITATEAAKLVNKFSKSGNENSHELLSKAFKFWIKNEKPYPVGGGAIPESPRAEILSTMIKIKPSNSNYLIGYLSDTRRDVVDVAKGELLQRIKSDASLCDQFINSIEAQLIEPSHLVAAINSNIQFNPQQVVAICEMLEHKEPRVRFSAFKILKSDYIPEQLRIKWLKIAMKDTVAEIREEAVLLDTNFIKMPATEDE